MPRRSILSTADRINLLALTPASTMPTDGVGRVQLDAANVPSVRIEVPGFAVTNVNLRSVISTVELP